MSLPVHLSQKHFYLNEDIKGYFINAKICLSQKGVLASLEFMMSLVSAATVSFFRSCIAISQAILQGGLEGIKKTGKAKRVFYEFTNEAMIFLAFSIYSIFFLYEGIFWSGRKLKELPISKENLYQSQQLRPYFYDLFQQLTHFNYQLQQRCCELEIERDNVKNLQNKQKQKIHDLNEEINQIRNLHQERDKELLRVQNSHNLLQNKLDYIQTQMGICQKDQQKIQAIMTKPPVFFLRQPSL